MSIHYLNQCWNIGNWTLGNKFQWNFNQNFNFFIHKNVFESFVCKMALILSQPQFPHLAIAVSPRMEVKSSGHAWLDGCNFQRKRLLAPTQCRQRHSVRTEMMREIYMNSSTTTTLYFFLWNDFCNPSRVLIMQLLFLMKLHSFTDKPTATKVKLGYSKEMVEFFILM